jgi:hypothetical protein
MSELINLRLSHLIKDYYYYYYYYKTGVLLAVLAKNVGCKARI